MQLLTALFLQNFRTKNSEKWTENVAIISRRIRRRNH